VTRRNVVLMPVGSHGDVHPFVGVGKALAARGHAVRAFTSGYYASLFEAVGIELHDAFPAQQFRALLDDPMLWRPGIRAVRHVVAMAIEQAAGQYAWLAERAGDPDLLVIASPLAFGARVAQDRFGLRLATLQLSPGAIPSVVDPPRLPGLFMPRWLPLWARRAQRAVLTRLGDRLFARVNQLRREVGLGPARDIVGGWWNSPSLTLGLFPEWFSGHPVDWPPSVRLTDFPLYDESDVAAVNPETGRFLAACADRGGAVVFTPGSAMTQGAAFFAAAVEACATLDRPGLLLTRHPGQLPRRLPPLVRHEPYLPFSAVLPRAAALVYHGGIGTLSQACAAGTAQLLMPMAHDQFDNAARIERLGLGRTLERRRFRGPALAAALDDLLGDERIARRCQEVAGRLRASYGIGRTCDLLEAMP
jgi:UDP:flavonoid glycosyltransferase YjiC (YdhE family)